MSFFTKTIICKPQEYDLKFKEWKEELKKSISAYEFPNKITVSHDGDNHYILYSVGFSLPKR